MCIQDYLNIWRLMWFGFWTTVAISNGMSYVIGQMFFSTSFQENNLFPLYCLKHWSTAFVLNEIEPLLLCLLSFFSVLLPFYALYCIFCCHFSLQIWSNPLPIQISLIHCHNQWSVNFAVCFVIFSLPWLHFSNSKSG